MERSSALMFVLLCVLSQVPASMPAIALGTDDELPPVSVKEFPCEWQGEDLVLHLPFPRGRELAVKTPSGIYYQLDMKAFSSEDGPIRISRTVQGYRAQFGNERWEEVFTESGEYEIANADRLQTDTVVDGEVPPHVCRVRFEQK